MINRRNLGALLLPSIALSACSTSRDPQKIDFSTPKTSELFDTLTVEESLIEFQRAQNAPSIAMGTARSRHLEIRNSFKLMWDSPRTNDHMEIARYFENITLENPREVKSNGTNALYNEEWVVGSNPLISAMFGMTSLEPNNGDQTAWCAAFVSFVLYAAGKKTAFSALSGAYRNYSKPTSNPKFGDIVTFSKYGNKGKKGFGHVGFFVSRDENGTYVLGGNQSGHTVTTGKVNTKYFLDKGPNLFLVGYREVL